MLYQKDSAKIYVLKYDINKEVAGGVSNVSLYVEVSDDSMLPEQGDYQLDIYLSIEPIAFRNYVDSIVSGQLDNTFYLLVQDMLHSD